VFTASDLRSLNNYDFKTEKKKWYHEFCFGMFIWSITHTKVKQCQIKLTFSEDC